MRPVVRFLSDDLIRQIVAEARGLLTVLGVEIHNAGVLGMLADHGARLNDAQQRAHLTDDLIDRALRAAPRSFKLHDVFGQPTHDLSGLNVYFTPGSAAIHILDSDGETIRTPTAADYVKYARIVEQLPHLAAQSTALVPGDVHQNISDSYRLFLSLLYCRKPVVTGAFTIDAFTIMRDLQLAVRGSNAALRAKPLTVFSCCPTAPLKWSDVTSQNVVDCARYSIPVEFIAMPLAGFVAPVTLVGTLVQHTAETLSGLVISQLANMGATLAALAGINSVSGPGMLDFESCLSLEKLVVDNETCGMALRLVKGIEPREDFPALPHFEELLQTGHLLIAKHTRRYLRDEHYFPGCVIDRANRPRWQAEGGLSLRARARREVDRLLVSYQPVDLPKEVQADLSERMAREARRYGMDTLPHTDL